MADPDTLTDAYIKLIRAVFVKDPNTGREPVTRCRREAVPHAISRDRRHLVMEVWWAGCSWKDWYRQCPEPEAPARDVVQVAGRWYRLVRTLDAKLHLSGESWTPEIRALVERDCRFLAEMQIIEREKPPKKTRKQRVQSFRRTA